MQFRVAPFLIFRNLLALLFLQFRLSIKIRSREWFLYAVENQAKFRVKVKKHLVLLLLDPRCLFPSSGRCRVLVHGNASLSKEWLVLFTVGARIDPPEIPHMLVLPFKLLLQVILLRLLVRFRRPDRRLVRATSNQQQFRSFLRPMNIPR